MSGDAHDGPAPRGEQATGGGQQTEIATVRQLLRTEVGESGRGDGKWQPMVEAREVWALLDALDAVEAHCDEQDAEVVRHLADLRLAPPDPVGAFTSTTAVRRALAATYPPAKEATDD